MERSRPTYWSRALEGPLREAAGRFPLVSVSGARQCGKTTLCRAAFPGYRYVSLEDPDERRFATEDPRGFLETWPPGSILDEVQRVPDLFSYLQTAVDLRPESGQYILSGSQHFLLSERVSQSLAGRVAVLELPPLSFAEQDASGGRPQDPLKALLQGGYPNVLARGIPPEQFFPSYLQTYVERDVRLVTNVRDLGAFQTFLELLAGQAGSELNLHHLATASGKDWSTVQQWLSVLEASFLVFRHRPYHRNYRKRLIKAPKLYFTDTGLCCALLGIRTVEHLRQHPLYGALFENLIVADVRKEAAWRLRTSDLYHWRDRSAHEVDLVLEEGGQPMPVEIKATRTPRPEQSAGVERFLALSGTPRPGWLIHGGERERLSGNVRMLPWHATARLFSVGASGEDPRPAQ